MRKWFFIPFILTLTVLIVFVYLAIPNKISIHQTVILNAKQDAVFSSLSDKTTWAKWWPVNDSNETSKILNSYLLNSKRFYLADILTTSLLIDIKSKHSSTIKTSLDFISLSRDSLMLNWNTEIITSYNPIKRIKIYLNATAIKQDFKVVLKIMQSYFSKVENTYGILIEEVPVVDSTLIFTLDSSKGYPSTKFIYSLLDKLKNYSTLQGAQQSGYPMLNVYTVDSISYLVKVALPVNKKLKDEGSIKYKWMLGGGKILISDVTGETSKVDHAVKQLEYYLRDYNRVSPAIPFMSLITDRSKVLDSTKWITRIYYPVM